MTYDGPVRKLYEHTDNSGRRLEAWTWDEGGGGLNLIAIHRDDPEQPEERISVIIRPSEVGLLLGALQRHPTMTAVDGPVPTALGYMMTLTVGDAKIEISDSASLTAPAMALLAQGVSESMARFDALGEPPYAPGDEDEAEDVLRVFLNRIADLFNEPPYMPGGEDAPGYVLQRVAELQEDLTGAREAARGAAESAATADRERNNALRQLRQLENVLARSPLQSVIGPSVASAAGRAEALLEAAGEFVKIRRAFKARGRDFPPSHTAEAVDGALADQNALAELRGLLTGAGLTRLAAMTATDLANAVRELITSRQSARNDIDRLKVGVALKREGRIAELENVLREVRAEFADPNTEEPAAIDLVASQSAAIMAKIDRVLSGEESS